MAREIIRIKAEYDDKEDFLRDIYALPWDYRLLSADGSITLRNPQGIRIAGWSGTAGLGWTNYTAITGGDK